MRVAACRQASDFHKLARRLAFCVAQSFRNVGRTVRGRTITRDAVGAVRVWQLGRLFSVLGPNWQQPNRALVNMSYRKQLWSSGGSDSEMSAYPQHVCAIQFVVFGQSRTQLSRSALIWYCNAQERERQTGSVMIKNLLPKILVTKLISSCSSVNHAYTPNEYPVLKVITSFSRSTNSGWMVVEWIPSLWKNSFTWKNTNSFASWNST